MNIMTSSSSSKRRRVLGQGGVGAPRSAATAPAFASTTRSWRSRSSAARRATWYSQAVGLSGTPPSGHVCQRPDQRVLDGVLGQ